MERKTVQGDRKKHQVLLYALSTCGWCKMTKAWLVDNSIAYEYVDVDKLEHAEKEVVNKDIKSRGGRIAFPTVIIDDKTIITGFKKDKLTEALGL
ncbi:MAG: glutaredoxin family protein [Candidatus Hermodarchaeia archaeon]|jgi:glutaredoxin